MVKIDRENPEFRRMGLTRGVFLATFLALSVGIRTTSAFSFAPNGMLGRMVSKGIVLNAFRNRASFTVAAGARAQASLSFGDKVRK